MRASFSADAPFRPMYLPPPEQEAADEKAEQRERCPDGEPDEPGRKEEMRDRSDAERERKPDPDDDPSEHVREDAPHPRRLPGEQAALPVSGTRICPHAAQYAATPR